MSPSLLRRLMVWLLVFNLVNLAVWITMTPVTLVTGLQSSVPYISTISNWALVAAFLSGSISGVVALGQMQVRESLEEHRHRNRIFHRRVSSQLGIDPPEGPGA